MDAGQIQQVIMNLCMNAADAMPSGGDIRIRTERGRVVQEMAEDFLKLGSDAFAKVAVSDNGVGIDPKLLDRIFEPFFSTKEKQDRSGLGLSICHRIVREHGGFINVDSEPDMGTTVSVILPLLKGRVQEAYARDSQVEGGHETLLLVDDEKTMLESTADLLSGLGYRTITASAGGEAVDLFSKHKSEVDLVLLDLGMPGMDGAETFRRLRKIYPHVRVLLLTGLPQSEESQRALEEGVLDLVQKPFRLEELTAKIRDALGKH
jgi:CheY-like chemotaxis protein